MIKKISFQNDIASINQRIWLVLEELCSVYSFNLITLSEAIGCKQKDLIELESFIKFLEKKNKETEGFAKKKTKVTDLTKKIAEISLEKMGFKVGIKFRNAFNNSVAIKSDKVFQYYPSELLINKLEEVFGVNGNWLKSGKYGNRYNYGGNISLFRADDLKDFIANNKENIRKIYFILSDEDRSVYNVIFKISDYKYYIPRMNWGFGSYVGSTGSQQLISLYNFIKWLGSIEISKLGCLLSENDYAALCYGKMNPEIFLKNYNQFKFRYWWDDFTDIEHKNYPGQNGYEHYGKNFVDAQKIVRDGLA